MNKEEFQEVITYLQGAYTRTFPEAAITVAWGIFSNYPGPLVQQGAVRMVEEGETYPSPMMWLRRVKAIQSEALEDQRTKTNRARLEVHRQIPLTTGGRSVARPRRPDETDEERIAYLKALIGTTEHDGTAQRDDVLEYMRLLSNRIGTNAPQYPGMGLREILALVGSAKT